MAENKLFNGERYLIQTVDKRLAVTTHRVIQKRIPWTLFGNKSIMLEDITGWEEKQTGKPLYLLLCIATAFMIFFDNSFALLSVFFVLLYFMTRHRRVHVMSPDTTMVLPSEIAQTHIDSLLNVVKQAQQSRVSHLKKKSPKSEKVSLQAA
ncbi:hypothetical protein ACFSKU_20525 [Pontibacter silvestris]|uniref:Reticulon-like protein n=2 Tax=Pontibacter silvestris TaxID=2305183 RepID=A0ABW4X5B1_9BACT